MSEDLERALDRIAADRSPRDELPRLTDEERQMVRMAQLIRGSAGGQSRPGFAQELHGRVASSSGRISRRTAFVSGIATLAAGIVGGLGLDRLINRSDSLQRPPLVTSNKGKWMAVARVADVPPGAVRPFRAGAVQGFLMNRRGEYQAMSRICTHMGCALNFDRAQQELICPCHGAEFSLQGQHIPSLDYGYAKRLPSLPRLRVRTNGEHVEVWSA